MRKLFFLPLLAMVWFVGVCLSGCEEKPKEPDAPTDTAAFVITVENVTESSFDATITPKDAEMPYLAFYVEKTVYDDQIGDDDVLMESFLEQLTQTGAQQGATLEDVLAQLAQTGENTDTYEGLDAETGYYLCVAGVDAVGEVLTEVVKAEVTTSALTMQDISFTIEVTPKATTGVVTVTASKDDATFFMDVVSKKDFQESFNGDVTGYVNAMVEYYGRYGYDGAALFAELGSTGSDEMELASLRPGTDYLVVAVGVNPSFVPNSESDTKEFTTLTLPQSALEIEIDTLTVTQLDVKAQITASNSDEYLWSVVPQSTVDSYTSEDDLMYEFIGFLKENNMLEEQLATGNKEVEQKYLTPGTEYAIIAFAYDKEAEAPISKLYKKTVTTKPIGDENPCDMTFAFDVTDMTEAGFTLKITPSVVQWYNKGVMTKAQYDELNESGTLYETLSKQFNEYCQLYCMIYGMEMQEAAQMMSTIGYNEMKYEDVTPGTACVAYAFAVDMENGTAMCDKIHASDVFTTLGAAGGAASVAPRSAMPEFDVRDVATLKFGKAEGERPEIRRMVKFW